MCKSDRTNDNEIELSKSLTLHQTTHTALAGGQLDKCTQMDRYTNTFMAWQEANM